MSDQLTTIELIRLALDELIEIHGIEYLSYEIVGASKPWVLCKLRMLEANGEISIARGGGRGEAVSDIAKARGEPDDIAWIRVVARGYLGRYAPGMLEDYLRLLDG